MPFISGPTLLPLRAVPRLHRREGQVRDAPDQRAHQVPALLLPDGLLQRHLQRQLEPARALQEDPRQGHHDAQHPAGEVLGDDERGRGQVPPLDRVLVRKVRGVPPVRGREDGAEEDQNTGQDIRLALYSYVEINRELIEVNECSSCKTIPKVI